MNNQALMNALGYTFSNAQLLKTALTHPSCALGKGESHYQRLEFLGDAVLQQAVSKSLYFGLPGVAEGALTRRRARLVCEKSLSRAAIELGIGRHIRMSPGEVSGGGQEKPSILADVMEAILAAIYLDGGQEEADRFVRRIFSDRLLSPEEEDVDAKSQLQEFVQAKGMATPVYHITRQSGPPHDPTFTAQVRIKDEVVGEGSGKSKKEAQQRAAEDALFKQEHL